MVRALLLLVVSALAGSCVLATLPAPRVPSLRSFDDVWDVQTDFLHLGVRQGVAQRSTLFSMVHDVEMVRENCRLIRAAGGDSYAFYVYNERDGAGWDQFARPFNGYEDQGRVLDLTDEIVNNGCHPIPCLIPDDAPGLNGGPLTAPSQALEKCRRWWPELLPRLAERMERKILWLYLEGNEYLWPEEQIALIELAHQILPDFKLLVHWTPGRPAASPVRENQGQPKEQWTIPDPYEWEGSWWMAAQRAGGGHVGCAYQSAAMDPEKFREDLEDTLARATGKRGNWGVTFRLILGESQLYLPVQQIDRHARIARELGVKGSLHGVQRNEDDGGF